MCGIQRLMERLQGVLQGEFSVLQENTCACLGMHALRKMSRNSHRGILNSNKEGKAQWRSNRVSLQISAVLCIISLCWSDQFSELSAIVGFVPHNNK